ncbi:MAG: hypothetical protein AAGE85_18550, partial [Pseudomonadota bacterium]
MAPLGDRVARLGGIPLRVPLAVKVDRIRRERQGCDTAILADRDHNNPASLLRFLTASFQTALFSRSSSLNVSLQWYQMILIDLYDDVRFS